MLYKVKLVSQKNAGFLILIGLAILITIAKILLPARGLPSGLAILAVSIVAVIAHFLWQFFVTGRTTWAVDDDEIKIVWIRTFFGADSTDIIIKWSEIKDISRGLDPHYYNLKIKLVSGKTIKFFHDTLTTRDDFQDMLKTLYQTLNNRKDFSQQMHF